MQLNGFRTKIHATFCPNGQYLANLVTKQMLWSRSSMHLQSHPPQFGYDRVYEQPGKVESSHHQVRYRNVHVEPRRTEKNSSLHFQKVVQQCWVLGKSRAKANPTTS